MAAIPAETADASLPDSYTENTDKEELTLIRARNFRRQFAAQYEDRKPLLLIAKNECDVEKHICTFLRPSRLPFNELYYFDGCAEFIADYVTYEALSECNAFPRQLKAPMTTLRTQAGNCFEMAFTLCSLLTGVGYDAYCVIGYATKGITTLDESTEVCPVLRDGKEVDVLDDFEEESARNPYRIRAPKDLRSQFLEMMEKREEDAKEAELEKIRQEEEARQAEANKEKPDPYHGLRVHAWVLVLHGKREVASSFYLEPSTGERVDLKTDKYLGIEAIFNHGNYWINMQDGGSGVEEMVFDLKDITLWETMFSLDSDAGMSVKMPAAGENADLEQEDDEDQEEKEDARLAGLIEVPHSWTEPIKINSLDFDSRCPRGHKTTLYKQAKLEKHGQYVNKQGLMTRLIKYEDTLWKNESEVHEWYRHRSDFLKERTVDKATKEIHDVFNRGHSRSLKDHFHRVGAVGPEATRIMTYFLSGRKDDLAKREQTPTMMVEHFEGRDDFLYRREVDFGVRQKKFGPASEGKYRPILRIEEFFNRDTSKPADLDVERRRFYMTSGRILLKFHRKGNDITRNELSFSKPKNDLSTFALTMDMVEMYTVDSNDESNFSRLDLHRLYTSMVETRDKLLKVVRETEDEVAATLKEREEEERKLELNISMYDSSRNHDAKKKREELEKQHLEAIRIRKEKEKDYLSPFLVRLGDPAHLTSEQAAEVRQGCLDSLQKRMQHQATLMHAKFKADTKELMRVQRAFQAEERAGFRSSEADQAYKEQCDALNYRINLTQRRIARHKEESVKRFMKLEARLHKDPRLAAYRGPATSHHDVF